jgi:cytochrome c oxidase subunit 2
MIIAIAIVVGVATTAIAYFIPWLPDQASYQADGIDFVFWLATGICISIFALVSAVLLYMAWKFRAKPDDDSDGAPIHGHTGLEIAWTAVPAVLVTIIAVASAIVLARNERTGAHPLVVEVTAQQFAWSFKYANGVTSGDLRLPLDRTAVLRLNARDVIHSFFVPEFRQKQDAVPGIETTLVIKPTKLGSYPIVCTELCGLGHAVMRSQAVVMRPAAYAAWLDRRGKDLSGTPQEAGAAAFEENGCGTCHTFTKAGTNGKVGPNLDQLAAAAKQAGKPVNEYARESIVEPDAVVRKPYQSGVMPEIFGQLPRAQIDALVQYLTEGKGAKSTA